MKTNILIKILFGAICLVCASCSQEDTTLPVSAGDGQVKIVYKVTDSSMSRALDVIPDLGWNNDDWCENLITRIDLFVIDADIIYKHIRFPELNVVDNQNGEFNTPLTTTELTYNDVVNNDYNYYMIANCDQLESSTITKFSELQELMIKNPSPALSYNDKQKAFVMDSKVDEENEDEMLKVDANTAILSFDLSRAAVKICLSVIDVANESIRDKCKYRLYNYVESGTSILAESEEYGNGTDQIRQSMGNEVEASLTYNDSEDNGMGEVAVFYSYPNDWFDESLLENGVFKDPEHENYANNDLIDETRQTYIRLTAPFTGEDGQERMYYYKVPVNYSIADNNDQVSFTKEQIETLRNDYYRMQRNHIYYVKVKVDRKGGITEDDEVILQNMNYLVADWGEEDITIPEFE